MTLGPAQLTRYVGGSPPDPGVEGAVWATLLFASTGTERVYFVVHVPKDWAEGTDIKVALYWTPTSGAAGGVAWEMNWEAIAAESNETLGTGNTLVNMHDTTQELDNELLETPYGTIPGSALEQNDTIGIRIRRDHDDDDDTYGADAALIHVEIEYIADKLGEKM